MEELVKIYIGPYLDFASKWQNKNPGLQDEIDEITYKNTTGLKLKSNAEHAYLHYLSLSELEAEETKFEKYDIKNLTRETKNQILLNLQNRMEEYINANLPGIDKILKNIAENKPTGDAFVDYHVTLIKKKRGPFNTNRFGNTTTFKKLTEYAEEKHYLLEERLGTRHRRSVAIV